MANKTITITSGSTTVSLSVLEVSTNSAQSNSSNMQWSVHANSTSSGLVSYNFVVGSKTVSGAIEMSGSAGSYSGIESGTWTQAHNNDGSYTLQMSLTYAGQTKTNSFDLTRIWRGSALSSKPSTIKFGTSYTLGIKHLISNAYVICYAEFGGAKREIYRGQATSFTANLSMATYAQYITNGMSENGKLWIYTYTSSGYSSSIDSNYYGCKFEVADYSSDLASALSMTTPTNAGTNPSAWITGDAKISTTVTFSPLYGAAASVQIACFDASGAQVGGTTQTTQTSPYVYTSSAISTDGVITVRATITDSRGISASKTKTVTISSFVASTVTASAASVTMGQPITFTVSGPDVASLSHDLSYSINGAQQTGSIGTITVGSTTKSWTPSTTLASLVPNDWTLMCTITCASKNGGTIVGQTTTTVTLVVPDYSPTISIGTITNAGTKTEYGFIQGYAKLQATVTFASNYGGAATAYVSVGGGTFGTKTLTESGSFVSNVITSSGSISFAATVTDSRPNRDGYTHQKTVTVSPIPTVTITSYTAPSVVFYEPYRVASSGSSTRDDFGQYLYVRATFSITNIGAQSPPLVQIKYKKTSASTYTTAVSSTSYSGTIVSNTVFIGEDDSYEVIITANDNIVSMQSERRVLPSIYRQIDIGGGADHKGVAIGGPSIDSNFNVYIPTDFKSTPTVNGVPIGGNITVDSALSPTSTNPVQNKVINNALGGKLDTSGGTMTGPLTVSASAPSGGSYDAFAVLKSGLVCGRSIDDIKNDVRGTTQYDTSSSRTVLLFADGFKIEYGWRSITEAITLWNGGVYVGDDHEVTFNTTYPFLSGSTPAVFVSCSKNSTLWSATWDVTSTGFSFNMLRGSALASSGYTIEWAAFGRWK